MYAPVLAESDQVAHVKTEARGAVHRDHLVALLVTLVLGHEVKVITTDHDGALHLGGPDNTR